MQVAVRSYLMAGVALVGAGAIAVSPVRPSIPDIQVPALTASSAAVELSALADPIGQWTQVFATAFANLSQIGAAVIADPAPILRQIIANQIGYGQTIATGFAGAGQALVDYVTVTVPTSLQEMAVQVSQGDIAGASMTLVNAVGSLLLIGFPLFPLVAIPGQITDNITNVVHALTGFGTLLPLVFGALFPVEGTIAAAGETGQAFVNALGAGDPAAAFSALINAPAVITGAFLNGYTTQFGETPSTFTGLLSVGDSLFNGGLIQALSVTIPRLIAAAITPAPAELATKAALGAETAASTDPASVPAASAASVALATVVKPAADAPTAPDIDAAVTAADEPQANAPAATDDANFGTPSGVTGSGTRSLRSAGPVRSPLKSGGDPVKPGPRKAAHRFTNSDKNAGSPEGSAATGSVKSGGGEE